MLATQALLSIVFELSFLQILRRLSKYEGTYLTPLVRGLAPPPPVIEGAFSGLPAERFAVKHFPPNNPVFGFVADRLLLS